jgi:hypothetical protein
MPSIPRLSAYRGTLIVSVVLGLLLCQRHLGFAIGLVWVVLLPWVAVNMFSAYKQSGRWPLFITKTCIWALMSVAVLGWHVYLYYSVRAEAQRIVERVIASRRTNGVFPENLAVVGVSDEQRKNALGLSGYFRKESGAFLFYASTYVPFEVEQYDFAAARWTHTD